MSTRQTLEKRIQYRIKRNKDSVFMLSDFEDLADKDQVGRALRKLLFKNIIVKVGQGIYARAKISKVTQKPIPEKDIRSIAIDVMKKTGVKVLDSDYEKKYNAGESPQVPTGRLIGVNKRVSRKIGFNGNYIKYAKVSG